MSSESELASLAVGAVALSCAVTWLVLVLARRRRHFDVPNERSSHDEPTPRSGGVGIVLALVATFAIRRAMEPVGPETRADGIGLPGIAMALLMASGVGLVDDFRSLRPQIKLVLFLVPVWFATYDAVVHVAHGTPFAGDVHLGVAAWPLTLFWLACYPQAFNFMDGINGIAALSATVAGATFAAAGFRADDISLAVVGAAAAGSSLGFLPWNFPRARIFMGDAGSLPLGLLLAWCAVRANGTGALSFPASILLLGPFLFDVTFTLARRWRERKRLGAPHKEHLYQRLSRLWGSHAKVSLLYAGFSVVTGVLALGYAGMSELGKLLSLVLPTLAMLGFAALVLRAERKKGR